MSPSRHHKHHRIILLCIAIYLAGVVSYVFLSAATEKAAVMKHIDRSLWLAGGSLKYLLPADLADRALNAQSISHAEEDRLRAPLNAYAAEGGFRYLYTIVEQGGKFFFVISSWTAEDEKKPVYDYYLPYDDIPAGFVEAFRDGHPVYTDYTDQWGAFRSIAIPQTAAGGRRYLACADISLSEIHAQLFQCYLLSGLTGVFFFLLTIPFHLAYRDFLKSNNEELRQINSELLNYQVHLEDLVRGRTADLSEAKDLAEQANRVKSRFLFNVSHEIRTPMNAIVGHSEAVMGTDSIAQAHVYAKVILRESEILRQMIGDLLDHAKLEAGKMELENLPLNLGDLLKAITMTATMLAKVKGLSYECRLEQNVPPVVSGDFLRLRQVLLNLVSNAIKFTERGAVTVTISLMEELEDKVRLCFLVNDTGIGIPKEKQRTIFESFSQADLSTTRRFGGTGLGMTIAQQLVRLMGGELMVESEPGHGSTFWFDVLLGRAANTNPPDRYYWEPNYKTLKSVQCLGHLLVVEDYPANQNIVKLFLEEAGHRVTIAGNGREAVEVCGREPFDMILMDIQMPEMDGYEATSRIRHGSSVNARVPIVALTASAETSNRQECLEMGMNGIILKPFHRETLLLTVARWLDAGGHGGGKADEPDGHGEPSLAPLQIEIATAEFGSRQTVLEVARQFLLLLEKQLETMREALDRGDRAAVAREAHALKGGAGTLEAEPLAHAAIALEKMIKTGQPDERLRETFATLAKEAQRLQDYVSELNRPAGGGKD